MRLNKLTCVANWKIMNVFAFFLLLFLLLAVNKRSFAQSAYYTDGEYETSSVYADVATSERKNVIISNNSSSGQSVVKKSVPADNNKIYNTIVIRSTKKNNVEEKKTKENKEIAVEQKVAANEAKQNKPEPKKETSMSIAIKESMTKVGNFFKEVGNRASNPFYQKITDSWYGYGIINYGFASPSKMHLSAITDATESDKLDSDIRSLVTTENELDSSGFGVIFGAKMYFARHTFSAFISPEFFYSNLNFNPNSAKYNTKKWTWAIKDAVTKTNDATYILPVEAVVNPQSILGGSLRFGFTFVNTFSIFAKASIGAMRSGLTLKPRTDLIDWESMFNPEVTDITRSAIKTNVLKDISNPIMEGVNGEEKGANPSYVGVENYKTKSSLAYGLGCGFEFGFWNQHFTIRVDYDHYWTNGTFNLEGTAYPRLSAQTATVSKDNLGITSTDSGTRWRVKTNFGMLKLGLGFSF